MGNILRIISRLICNFSTERQTFYLDARETACPSIQLPATNLIHKCDLRSRVEVALADLDKFPLPYKRHKDTEIEAISERFNERSKKFKTLNRRFNRLLKFSNTFGF